MDRDEQTDRVNAVPNATKRQGEAHTHAVDEGTSEESDDGESTVEGGVLQ